MDLNKRMENLNKAARLFDSMTEKDKLLFMLALEEFLSFAEGLCEKYDPTKPFKMEVRRLDDWN